MDKPADGRFRIDFIARNNRTGSFRSYAFDHPADIAARFAADLIPVHREVHEWVTEHNAQDSRHPMGSGSDVR